MNWIEINTEDDLPNKDLYCWWVNRVNGSLFPAKLKEHLGRSLSHKTFSHYMIIKDIPVPPTERKQLERATSWTDFDVNEILRQNHKK